MKQNIQNSLALLPRDILCDWKTLAHPDRPVFADDGLTASQPRYFHSHDGYEIFMLLSGEMNFYAEGEGITVHPGNIVCIRPFAFHRGEVLTHESYDRVVINIRSETLRALNTEKSDLSLCFSQSGRRLSLYAPDNRERNDFLEHARILRDALLQESGTKVSAPAGFPDKKQPGADPRTAYGCDILARSHLEQLLLLLCRMALAESRNETAAAASEEGSIMPSLVSLIFSFVEDHLSEDLSLKRLSHELGRSGIYLSRCFKEITGISLQQYILNKRIQLAQKYLREGSSPSDVCYLSGFNNYSNFSRTFSAQAGLSPRQYQMSWRGADA